MKYKFIQASLLVLLPTLSAAYGNDDNDPTDNIDGLSISTDFKNSKVFAKGGGFFLQIKADSKWVASSQDSWCTINSKRGNGNVSTICSTSANGDNERYTVITVTSNGKNENITITQEEGNDEEPDPDSNPSGYTGRIGIPKLRGGSSNLFIAHTIQYNRKEIMTYSFKYDCTQKSSRQVAFTFNVSALDSNVGRAGGFNGDPSTPSQYRTHDGDYIGSGYSRGHLAASSDRQYSVVANKQVFYMSNVNLQIQDRFSGDIWASLEDKVQSRGEITDDQDTPYVAKGGTTDNNNIIRYLKADNIIPAPKYFYMATLLLRDGQYKAIDFWFEHKSYSNSSYAVYAFSIDELEEKTGIDFFHNLPDKIESGVEQSCDKSDWGL